MSLNRYWPTRDEINHCIKAEAESASDAVLLAVHQPMPLVRRDEGSKVAAQVGDHDLLEAFLSDDLPQGTLLMPITGPSGAGKSHLIRWLAAQLARDPRARRMYVIRIPKSASLRDVVERVLEPLAEDARFAEVRRSLDTAIAQVSPFAAAVSFSAALEIELDELHGRLLAALRNNPPESERKEFSRRANHALRLPGFLNDDSLRKHITNRVLTPIIRRAIEGRAELAPDEDELLPHFRADDLRIPEELSSELGQTSNRVRTYYQTCLSRAEGTGFDEAAKVLNEVVDGAIQRVFQLDQATGGVTLESIMLRVRELLLEQKRELALLIEDFAALSGIQQVLLNVCIQEAERDGQQVRSRMRTALALTDGYLDDRDTIATRAKQEWIIQLSTGSEDVLARTIELTGAYLNAARWGQQALQKAYKQSPHQNEKDLTDWVETFQDDTLAPNEADQLGAFGRNRLGVPLFPYNPLAISELVKRHLRTSGELRFNPRHIINFILRDILLSGREAFEKGAFPTPGFQDCKASASLASWLASEPLSEVERRRLEAVLVYWGGNPSELAQAARTPRELFQAFGLTRPKRLGVVNLVEGPGTPPTPSPLPEPDPTPPPAATPDMDGWRERLDAWASGTELAQRESNRIRSALKGSVEKAIPWNRLRLNKGVLRSSILLTIPNARGNDAVATIRVPIAEDNKDPDGQLRQALLGALRLDEAKGRLDYPEADEDSARVSTLIERLVENVIPHLERQRAQEARVLFWLLRRQARVMGLVSGARMPTFDIEVNATRHRDGENRAVATEQPNMTASWYKLRKEAADLRPALQQSLSERIGCFQGTTGDTVFAIDTTLLDLSTQPEKLDPSFLDHRVRDHLKQLKSRLAPTTRPIVDKFRTLSAKVDGLLGHEPNKQRLISALGQLFAELVSIGAWPDGYDRAKLRAQLKDFGKYDLMAQLRQAEPLLKGEEEIDLTADGTLELLGRLDLVVIQASDEFLGRIEAFVAAAERAMDSKEGDLSGVDPTHDAKQLEHVLQQIGRDLRTIIGDTMT